MNVLSLSQLSKFKQGGSTPPAGEVTVQQNAEAPLTRLPATKDVPVTPLDDLRYAVPRTSVEEQLNDVGNAELLIQRNGSDLRYVTEWKSFIVWDGHRWVRDKSKSRMHAFATKAVRHGWKEIYADLIDDG